MNFLSIYDKLLFVFERVIKKTREYNPHLDKNYSSIKIHRTKEEVIPSKLYKPKKLVLK